MYEGMGDEYIGGGGFGDTFGEIADWIGFIGEGWNISGALSAYSLCSGCGVR
jgi:hypothetical protein